jgi:tetratricopeptide (TPR) repeat protein
MTKKTYSGNYQKGLELAESGKHSEALNYFQEHLSYHPDDSEALNDTGAVLHCLGKTEEAIHYFLKAYRLAGNKPEIIWNLAESYLAAGRPDDAAALFDSMEKSQILNADVINRCANVFLNNQNKIGAINMLLRSLKLNSDQKILTDMIKVIRSKTAKVAIFCGADGRNFLDEIVDYLNQRFETRLFQPNKNQHIEELIQWADINWFEWCTELAVEGSKCKKSKFNIIRLHRYEAYMPWPKMVNWKNIDMLITVGNSFVKEALYTQVPDINKTTVVQTIPNGVSLDKFKFVNRNRGKNIVFLANLRMVKNPAFILQCMQKLHYIDPTYHLYFAGRFLDYALEQYIRHIVNAMNLTEVVHIDGWQNDINSYLADKHYIVSTSYIESQGVGILEAMACGLKPVIHNFPGADEIFEQEYLFNISEDFCRQVQSESFEPAKYRSFVEEKYSLKKQLAKIDWIFTQMQLEIDSKASGEAPSQLPGAGENGLQAAMKTDMSPERSKWSNLYS